MTLRLESAGNDANYLSEPVGTDEQRWYAIWTRARHEKVVRDRLRGHRIETLLPLGKQLSQWKDRRKVIEVPLFPGYCMARFSITDRLIILKTPGVVNIVRHQGRIAPIPDEEINALRAIVQCGFPCRPHPFLAEGMWVEVVRGPLIGVKGIFLRHDRPARLVIGVTLIHQAATVEIDVADVTLLREPPRREPYTAIW